MLRIPRHNGPLTASLAVTGLGSIERSQLVLRYVETHRGDYQVILWTDVTSMERTRANFELCAADPGLLIENTISEDKALKDEAVVWAFLQWLFRIKGAEAKWLVVIDNADDLS